MRFGAGLVCLLFIFGIIAGSAAVFGRGGTQPSVKAVDVVYTARGAIDNNAAADAYRIANEKARDDAEIATGRARVEAAREAELARLDIQYRQTTRHLLVIGTGVGLLTLTALAGSLVWYIGGKSRLLANTMAPGRHGLPVVYDRKRGVLVNANLQSTTVLSMDALEQLPADTQAEIYKWAQRSRIATSMAEQKVLPTQVIKERQHVTNVLQVAEDEPAPAITIAEPPEPEFVPRGYIVDNGITQEVQKI